MNRREFAKLTGIAAAVASSGSRARAQAAVQNSAGTELPKLKAPPNACDCHHHIYDLRFPPVPNIQGNPFQPNARVEEYRLLQRRLGLTRSIVVTPAPYRGKNDVTIDALMQFGSNARGVVLGGPDLTDAELRRLHRAGVRGVRFGPNFPVEENEPLTRRMSDLGWHAEVNLTGDRIVAAADVLSSLVVPLVLDHLGYLLPAGTSHPGFAVIRRLLDGGRAWMKLSGAYYTTTPDGVAVARNLTDYSGATQVAQAFVKAAPERLVWGSDWPHPGLPSDAKPDDATLFDLLEQWAPTDSTRHRILVENPARLYGFGS